MAFEATTARSIDGFTRREVDLSFARKIRSLSLGETQGSSKIHGVPKEFLSKIILILIEVKNGVKSQNIFKYFDAFQGIPRASCHH